MHAPFSPAPQRFPDPSLLADAETYYLPRSVRAALVREAHVAGASDWRVYAQDKLNTTLAQHALPLDGSHADALRQYALTLGLEPHELLLTLLAPAVARRERVLRHSITFLRTHVPRRPSGCLTLIFWGLAGVGGWSVVQWLAHVTSSLLLHF